MNELHRAVELLETGWCNSRILVVGDVMLDKYVRGDVERISPEAPVPVVRVAQQHHSPGGAANVAMNIVALGASVTLMGFVGDDEDRTLLEQALASSGVDARLVEIQGIPTTSKLRVMSGNHQLLRLDFESVSSQNNSEAHQGLEQRALTVLRDVQAVVLSDYGKGVLTPTLCKNLIDACRDKNIPVLVDPKGRSFDKYSGATTICPNRLELATVTGHSDLPELLAAGQLLVEKLRLDYLTVTLSEKGIAILSQNEVQISPAVAKQVYDVSGAGDTVIATLSVAIAGGLKLSTAVALANSAAGVVVSKLGTVPISKHELLGTLSEDISIHKEEKVLTVSRLLARAAEWRAAGNRIVLTNGCFDVLHVGHVTLLEEARRQGTKLIVAINSDRSVRSLKGPSRPIVAERERSQVLAALAAVDAVVIFDEATPLRLIEAVRPDVLVKGGDYTPETVVGAQQMVTWGGRVSIVPVVEGFSTTKLIERVATAID